jgi:hypothetical protein
LLSFWQRHSWRGRPRFRGVLLTTTLSRTSYLKSSASRCICTGFTVPALLFQLQTSRHGFVRFNLFRSGRSRSRVLFLLLSLHGFLGQSRRSSSVWVVRLRGHGSVSALSGVFLREFLFNGVHFCHFSFRGFFHRFLQRLASLLRLVDSFCSIIFRVFLIQSFLF